MNPGYTRVFLLCNYNSKVLGDENMRKEEGSKSDNGFGEDQKPRSRRQRMIDLISLLSIPVLAVIAYFAGWLSPENWVDLADQVHQTFIVDERWKWLLNGLGNTLAMTALSLVIGVVIGIILAIIRVSHDSGHRMGVFNTLAEAYITVIRGTPVVVQIMIWYFIIFASAPGMSKLAIASIAFGVNSGAYVAEIFRAGITSLDKGQMEAGRSLGFTYSQTMRLIILPQALKNTLPTLFNEFIALLKETSVSGYIAFTDLTRAGQNIRTATLSPLPLFGVALIYLAVVMILTKAMRKLERRLDHNDKR